MPVLDLTAKGELRWDATGVLLATILFPDDPELHQPECRPLVAPALNQHVENLTFVVNGTPQVHPGNPDYHLVEVRPIARAWAGPSQLSCYPGPELQNPAPHRLIGSLQAALGQQLLDVAVAQCEAEV
jgi:hypothetical protein